MASEIDRLIEKLERFPSEFRFSSTGLVLEHTPSHTRFWIGAGPWGLYEPVKADFTFWDTRKFKRAIGGWVEAERRRRLMMMFTSNNELVGGDQPHQYGRVR